MKPEDPLPSSSSRRETSPAPEKLRAKRIGCMSAIFRLIYNYHNRRRLLTSGKKQQKTTPSTVLICPPDPKRQQQLQQQQQNEAVCAKNSSPVRMSCGVPRSPTLPADMRRSRAGLTGLNDDDNIPTPGTMVMPEPTSTAAVEEKRRRLLGALEKCDEDLKALKKIIELVKSSVGGGDDNKEDCSSNTFGDVIKREDLDQLSTASSALHHLTRSALASCCSKRYTIGIGRVPLQQKKKPGEDDDIGNICFWDRLTNPVRPLWTSKAMVESVGEVCKDVAWGEKREMGRLCLALQDHICRDLIEEFIGEMGSCASNIMHPLPFQSCKRRLQF